MPFAHWFRPPRRVLAIFLCIMLVCSGALGWLGWQVLEQERALEGQRLQERLELAASHVAASLEHDLVDLDRYLNFLPGTAAKEPPGGVVVLLATAHSVNVYPPGRVLFYPQGPAVEEAAAATFAAGEKLEHEGNDPARAAESFRTLARSPDPGMRAGALLRLGRNLRKSGRNQEALQAYNELAQLGAVGVMGVPAALMASEARCSVLEGMGDRDALRKEASIMYSALFSGKWSLSRPVWEFHMEEARRWTEAGPLTERQQNALALANATEWIHDQWLAGHEWKGRRILRVEDRPVLVSWLADAGRLAAVLAGPGYLGSVWKEALEGRRARVALVDGDGQVVLGAVEKNVQQVLRTASAGGLPWTLHATSADSGADTAASVARRRLILAGFAVLALVLLAGSYFIFRSIAREHAVARLQSEFVSAVSHEFRTPLTSLRQLSDMLSKGRVPEDSRQESYEILSRESERLQRLVESVLDFGRMEARGFRYRLEDLDPATIVRDVVAEFRDNAAAQGYRIELAGAAEYPLIRADREALGLALWNLLDNAVKYSPQCRTVWVVMALDGRRISIQIRDRGMGIPASEQKEIFKRFVRGAASRASHTKGTGIGLAMALYIIEAHDGVIGLRSEPGKGSTFTILLPLEKVT